MFRYLLLFILLYLLIAIPSHAADLTITVSTTPGATSTEVQLIGGSVSLNSPKALYFTLDKGVLSTTVPASVIETAFPGTNYICVTARKFGTLVWWLHADGTPSCVRWPTTIVSPPTPVVTPPPPPIVVPPPPATNALRDALHASITTCLNKRLTLTTCLKLIDTEIQKVQP